jgi:site-specific DNA-adenine methylase
MKTYGLPYKGSKDKIADKICSLFPIKENFYDLFMGGGSITHYQLLQNQYKNYYANDFNPLVVKAFDMAIHGKFKNETRWISHEEFDKLKNIDPYVAFCFSFGNDLKSYAYGKEIEPYKKALHYLIVFQDESLMKEIFPNIDFSFVNKIKDVNERRLIVQYFMRKNQIGIDSPLKSSIEESRLLQHSNRLECFEKLESCQRLASIERLAIYNKSYDEIEIKPNSVIYLDPPYKDTNKYEISKDFDYEKFYSWCERQTELCFISEYSMPKDRFTCIAEIEHRSIICANENQSVIERIFLPNHQVKDYTIPSLFDL